MYGHAIPIWALFLTWKINETHKEMGFNINSKIWLFKHPLLDLGFYSITSSKLSSYPPLFIYFHNHQTPSHHNVGAPLVKGEPY
jgi:hypothetical protein